MQSVKLVYPTPSDDPIFPADYPFNIGDANKTFWLNSRKHSTVLGCVDAYEICTADMLTCWNSTTLDRQDPLSPETLPTFSSAEAGAAFLAIRLALIHSHIYNAIRMRAASALIAQSGFQDPISAALHPRQWQLELGKMFRTSLARAQIELVDIASGAWADTPGFVNHMNARQREYICPMVAVQAAGKLGVSVRGLGLVLGLCAGVVLLSVNPGEELVVLGFVTTYASQGWEVGKAGVKLLRAGIRAVYAHVLSAWQVCSDWVGELGTIRL